jgi:hypothetical protein
MQFRLNRRREPVAPQQRKDGDCPTCAMGERWPRTPRVIRWAWAAGISALVVAQAATGQDPETQTLIRLIHDLSELLDTRTQEELQRPIGPAPTTAPAPRPTPASP